MMNEKIFKQLVTKKELDSKLESTKKELLAKLASKAELAEVKKEVSVLKQDVSVLKQDMVTVKKTLGNLAIQTEKNTHAIDNLTIQTVKNMQEIKEIKENMVTKADHNLVMNTLDEVLRTVRKVDEDRVFVVGVD
ncbi:MAG: hypothetical protein AB1393_12745 [Candidatus Edwardsbacteria bacterium]